MKEYIMKQDKKPPDLEILLNSKVLMPKMYSFEEVRGLLKAYKYKMKEEIKGELPKEMEYDKLEKCPFHQDNYQFQCDCATPFNHAIKQVQEMLKRIL